MADVRSSVGHTLIVVPVFSFDIKDVFDLGDGYQGITLIGPPVETSGGLAFGDTLLVLTKNGGQVPCECVEFPLISTLITGSPARRLTNPITRCRDQPHSAMQGQTTDEAPTKRLTQNDSR